uniref:Uncharacterized protein n=1 Tax=viral metagenome TaxID=1070528 RepID=A0A6C0HNL7_9ZZZZ
MDITSDELFITVTASNIPKPPKSIVFSLDNASIVELFEFLLEFFTDLCKYYYGNASGQVDINSLSQNQLERLNAFMASIGFNIIFTQKQATFDNCQYYSLNRYDKIPITNQTLLVELLFSIKCGQTLNIIQFSTL